MGHFFTFVSQNIWVVLCFVLSGAFLAWGGFKGKSAAKELDTNGVTQLINSKQPLIVDVRKLDEFKRGHFPGATSVPAADVQVRAASLDLARPVLVVDRGGNEAPAAVRILTKAGAKEIYTLRGGMLQWFSAGLPLAD